MAGELLPAGHLLQLVLLVVYLPAGQELQLVLAAAEVLPAAQPARTRDLACFTCSIQGALLHFVHAGTHVRPQQYNDSTTRANARAFKATSAIRTTASACDERAGVGHVVLLQELPWSYLPAAQFLQVPPELDTLPPEQLKQLALVDPELLPAGQATLFVCV